MENNIGFIRIKCDNNLMIFHMILFYILLKNNIDTIEIYGECENFSLNKNLTKEIIC